MPGLIGVTSIILAWQLAVMATGVSPDILPSPGRVMTMLWRFRAQLLDHTIPTLQETLIGFCATIVVAATVAVISDFFPLIRRFVYPILVISQTIPIIVIAPLMVIWFGYGLFPKIIVIVIVTFFSVAIALTDGFDSTEPEAANLLRSMGASRWQQFYYVRLPGALPNFFTGLRIAITWSVTAAIFGEYVGAEKGLGIFMQIAKNDFRTDLVLAAVVIVSALSLVLFATILFLRRLIIPWHTVSQAGEKK